MNQLSNETENREKPFAEFKDRDIVTISDVMDRFGYGYSIAAEQIRAWKFQLQKEGRDKLDLKGRLTKADYAYILGIDVKLLY